MWPERYCCRAPNPAQPAPLKIGLVMKLSGNGASMARSVDASIAAYFALHGGAMLGGRPVVIIRRDDTEVPEVGRRLAQELVVQDKVDILLGGTATPESVAIAEISTQAKIPYFIINATTPGILAKAPMPFAPPRWRPSLPTAGEFGREERT